MAKKKSRFNSGIRLGAAVLFIAGAAVFLERLSKATEEPESIDDANTYLDMGPAVLSDEADAPVSEQNVPTLYEKFGKRALDKVLAFFSLIILAPVYALIAAAIEVDDPGPVLFRQIRVGKGRHFFELHKFRSMKKDAPHDVPYRDLDEAEKYTTRVGRFLRRTSLDELPQIWDIYRGKMSFVGPRPVLWNTSELIREREKYGANDVRPGLTGLAQINGSSELGTAEKARLDGEYVKALREGELSGFLTDLRCFAETVGAVTVRTEEDTVCDG